MNIRQLTIGVLVGLLWIGADGPAAQAEQSLQRVSDAAVFVSVRGMGPKNKTVKWTGTGFVVDPSGIIVTNHHVVQNKSGKFLSAKVTFFPGTNDGFECTATYLGSHPTRDVALLRCDIEGRNLTAVDVRRTGTADMGSQVSYAGFPAGLVRKVEGQPAPRVMLSRAGLGSVRTDSKGHPFWLDLDNATAGGSSGSAIVDSEGRVVGVLSRSSYDVSRGVPALCIQELLGESLIKLATSKKGKNTVLTVTGGVAGVKPRSASATWASDQKSIRFTKKGDTLIATLRNPNNRNGKDQNLLAVDVTMTSGLQVRRLVRIGSNPNASPRLFAVLNSATVSDTKKFGVPYDF
ncbi:MAG: serine protease, partial [Planctomycetota bacterium]